MVEANVLEFFATFRAQPGLHDGIDQLSLKFTPYLFLLGSLIVSCASYFNEALACFIPTGPGEKEFIKYVDNHCWSEGTIVLPDKGYMPMGKRSWDEARKTGQIYYYQWIPVYLAIQCIVLFIPYMIWKNQFLNRSGCDFTNLLQQAKDARNKNDEESTKCVEKVALHLEQVIYSHRDNRTSRLANVKRGMVSWFGLMIPSKRQSTHLIFWYLLVKILFLGVVFSQIFLIQSFFGPMKSPYTFLSDLYQEILEGSTLHNTNLFPKVTFCHLDGMKFIGTHENAYVAQCVLAVNMLSEKVYLALYAWLLFMTVLVFINLIVWLYRCLFYCRVKFIKRALAGHDVDTRKEKHIIAGFTGDFMRHNGLFILRMFYYGMGPLFTSRLINQLWLNYKKNHFSKNLSKAYSSKTDFDEMTLPKFDEKLYCEKVDIAML